MDDLDWQNKHSEVTMSINESSPAIRDWLAKRRIHATNPKWLNKPKDKPTGPKWLTTPRANSIGLKWLLKPKVTTHNED